MSDDNETGMAMGVCPECGEILNSHQYLKCRIDGSDAQEVRREPKPGDLSVCGKCGEPLEFGEPGAVNRLSVSRFLELPEGARSTIEVIYRHFRKKEPEETTSGWKRILRGMKL